MAKADVEDVLRQLQQRCECIRELENLTVQHVWDLRNSMNRKTSKGLHEWLVYSPRDLSVYIRTEINGQTVVDVALCTQDVTRNSDCHLDDTNLHERCGSLVGTPAAIGALQRLVVSLSPVVGEFLRERFVHRIIRHDVEDRALFTVELALATLWEKGVEWQQDHWLELEMPTINPCRMWGADSHERVPFGPATQRHYAAWLICMALYRGGLTVDTMKLCHEEIRVAAKHFNEKFMAKPLNYESLFRNRSSSYQSGRHVWPVVLAYGTSYALTPGTHATHSAHGMHGRRDRDGIYTVDQTLRATLAKYNGRYTLAQCASWLAAGVAAVFLLKWNVVAGIVPLCILSILALCRNNSTPQAAFVRSRDVDPGLRADDEKLAIRLLLSESCRVLYGPENLCFTGPASDYTGTLLFGFRFSYELLCKVGFERLATAHGRELLQVPITQRVMQMTSHDDGGTDHFAPLLGPDAQLLFKRDWVSHCDPGGPHAVSKQAVAQLIRRVRDSTSGIPPDGAVPPLWRSSRPSEVCTEMTMLLAVEYVQEHYREAFEANRDRMTDTMTALKGQVMQTTVRICGPQKAAKVARLAELLWKFRMWRDVNDPHDVLEGFHHIRDQVVHASGLYSTAFERRPAYAHARPGEGQLYAALSYVHHSREQRLTHDDLRCIGDAAAACATLLGREVFIWWDSRANEKKYRQASCVESDWLQHGIRPYFQLPVIGLKRTASDRARGSYDERLWTSIEKAAATFGRGVVFLDGDGDEDCDPNASFLRYDDRSIAQVASRLVDGKFDDKRTSFAFELQTFKEQARPYRNLTGSR